MSRAVAVCLPLWLVLAGCSEVGLPALERELAELRVRPTGEIASLPRTPQYRAVTYDQGDGRSPFLPERPETERAGGGGNLAPDLSRPRDPLEAYALDSLRLVGTLSVDGRRSALVRDPQGQVHRLHAGEHMGTDFGRIVGITDSSVQLVEIVSNGQGGWTERSRNISLDHAADEQDPG